MESFKFTLICLQDKLLSVLCMTSFFASDCNESFLPRESFYSVWTSRRRFQIWIRWIFSYGM